MRVLNFILTFVTTNLLFSCRPSSNLRNEINSSKYYYSEVTLTELIKNKVQYHNKTVQVKEYYMCGFEKSIILPKLIIPNTLDSSQYYYEWSSAIWIDVKYRKSNLSCDSLSNKIITVKGIFDTSKHGHLGNYIATIKDAILIK